MITPRLGYRPQKWCVFMVDEIQLSPKRRFKLKESARDRHNPKSQLQAPIYQPHMIHQHLWYERRDLNTASIAGTKTHSLLKCTVCSDWLTSSDQAVLCRSSSDVTHHNQNWTVLPVLILKVWKKKKQPLGYNDDVSVLPDTVCTSRSGSGYESTTSFHVFLRTIQHITAVS